MPRRPSGLWRNGDFVRLWTAGTISVFGSLITRTALPFAAILVLGAGPIDIAILRGLELLAGLLFGFVAGAWVDRLRRRPVMIVADLGRALLLGTIPVASIIGVLGMGQLFIVAFGAAILTTFFDIADRSFLPTVVGAGELLEANSKLTASSAAAEFSAFGIGGFLITLFSAPIAIAVDAVSFAVSALFIGSIRRLEPKPPPVETRQSVIHEIRAGVRLVVHDPILAPIAGSIAAMQAGWGVFGATYLLFASQELGLSAALIGLIAAVGGASSFVGALLAERTTRALGVGRTLIASLVLATVGFLFIPLAPAGAIAVGAACLVVQQLVADSSITVFDIAETSLRQSIVEDRLLGRVNGSIRVFALIAQLGATLAGGFIAEVVGLRAALVVGSLGGLVGAILLLVSPVRRLTSIPTRPYTLAAEAAAATPDVGASV